MNLILALDLKGGLVVHGRSGARESYRPLDWGLSSTAEPAGYLAALKPRHLYIADLDRIGGGSDNDREIADLAGRVETCYVDAGYRSADECRSVERFVPILGTETAGDALGDCPRALLSLDCRDGLAIPWNEDPVRSLERLQDLSFAGYLVLDISAVGTGRGLDAGLLARLRTATERQLFFGGGVRTAGDLDLLRDAGFEGAIVATAVHRGTIPLDAVRSGRWC